MRKKIIVLLVITCMILSLTVCGNEEYRATQKHSVLYHDENTFVLTNPKYYNTGVEDSTLKENDSYSSIDKPLKDCKIVTLGDSLVENGGWQDVIATLTGATVLNMGCGGTTMCNRDTSYWFNPNGQWLDYGYNEKPSDDAVLCWDAISGYPVGNEYTTDRISLIPTDTDIVLVEFGTNDLHQSKQIGEWSDTTNDTFKGAMKLCAERIKTRIPLATVIFVTPTVERTYYENINLNHKKDYINAILEAELEINVPVINLWSLTSWSIATYPNYSTDNLHWNNEGKRVVGNIISGWLNGWWYNNDTYPKDGWKKISDKWYAFDLHGYMREGWYRVNTNWYYLQPSSGHMISGWQNINDVLYYFTQNGVMATGWQYIDNRLYYFTSGGALATDWQYIDNTFYYFTTEGKMATGWQSIDGVWYYFKSSGEMTTGWLKQNDTWYYLKPNGEMSKGWVDRNGTWYYFYSNGAMATDTWIGDYYVNPSGAWIR